MYKTWLITLVFMVCAGVSGTVGETTLSVEQLASHNHWISSGIAQTGDNSVRLSWGKDYNPYHKGASINVSGGSQSHTHNLSGSSGGASNLPPCYVLAWVMRIA